MGVKPIDNCKVPMLYDQKIVPLSRSEKEAVVKTAGGQRVFMKAFEFDHNLINSYARFSRSFSTVRAQDIGEEINRQYDEGRFWPDALLSLNPRFLSGPTVDDLVRSGVLISAEK